ncbi:hypothetical protein LFAB_14660 [Lactiplantibacillus fabifermentans T30PCM01]|uniref:Uncharacterized protein n=1 Tax=Lactiplantibacillus fabifermentans T30PCM01 TaxID=1400520 RepID=W6T553_9LACO|nr:hypothetical protein LFAB_14660 [Lactiplantibacillus fabifermentans T30PCM01]
MFLAGVVWPLRTWADLIDLRVMKGCQAPHAELEAEKQTHLNNKTK